MVLIFFVDLGSKKVVVTMLILALTDFIFSLNTIAHFGLYTQCGYWLMLKTILT